MASWELESLVERVVEAVTHTGTYGFDPSNIRELIESPAISLGFTHQARLNDASFRTNNNVVDEELLDAIHERLEDHPEIEIRSSEYGPGRRRKNAGGDSTPAVEDEDTETSPKRMFVTREPMWQAITGTSFKDAWARVPQLEFDLLSVIAAHGTGGVIQGRLTNLAGQDKQSVPRRTDFLATKGYILKTAVLDQGHETSLLRLKKFVEADDVRHDDPSRPAVTRDQKGRVNVDLAPLLVQTVNLVKLQPDQIMAIEDLGTALGFPQKTKLERLRFLKCVRRLAESGCFLKCSAQPSDHDGAVMSESVLCLRLVREPTDADKAQWLRSYFPTGRARKNTTGQGEDSDSESERTGTDLDEPGDVAEDVLGDPQEDSVKEERRTSVYPAAVTPQFTSTLRIVDDESSADVPSTDVHSSVSVSDLHDSRDLPLADLTPRPRPPQRKRPPLPGAVGKGMGRRRNLEGRRRALGRHTESADVEAITPGVAHGIEGNSNRAAEGLAVQMQVDVETDKWGFPRAPPEMFVGEDGRASLMQCQPLLAVPDLSSHSGPTPKPPSPRKERRPGFAQPIRTSGKTTILQPKPVIRPRIASEREHEQFEHWAKVTAEKLARAELHERHPPTVDSTSVDVDDSEPARKRRRLDLDEDDTMQHRFAEIEAEILSRERPGVYLNPPGAKDIKTQCLKQRGRPRDAQIVVIKGVWLSSLQWFRQDIVRAAPSAKRRSISPLSVSDPSRVAEATSIQMGDPSRAAAAGTETGAHVDAADSVKDTVPAGPPERKAAEVDMPPGLQAEATALPASDTASALDTVSPERDLISAPTPQRPSPRSSEQTTTTSVMPQASFLFMPDAPAAAAPDSMRFKKAYVLAHPDEEFHHIGGGSWKRGPKTNKKRPQATELVTEPKPMGAAPTATESQGPAAKRPRRAVQSYGGQAAGYAPELDDTDTREGGSDTGDSPDTTSTQFRIVLVDSTKGSHPINTSNQDSATNAPPGAASETDRHQSNTPPAVTKDIMPPPTFDGAYFAHKGEEFHHVGNGRYRPGPRSLNLKSKPGAEDALVPLLSGTVATTVGSEDEDARTPEVRTREDQAAAGSNGIGVAKTILIDPQLLALDDGHSRVVETPTTNPPPAVLRQPGAIAEDLLPELANDPQSVDVPTLRSHIDAATLAAETTQEERATGDSTDKKTTAEWSRIRTRLVLDIIHRCGGAFPGNKEIWHPYAANWRKCHDRLPQRTAVDRTVKGLLDSSKLKKITFSFQGPDGMNETRGILATPDVDATSDQISSLKAAIIKAFPAPYIPPEAEVSDVLPDDSNAHTGVSGPPVADASTKEPRGTVKRRRNAAEFPNVDGLTVIRTQQYLDSVESQREKERDKQLAIQEKKQKAERVAQELKELKSLYSSGIDWLCLSSNQTFYPSSGTFGTVAVKPTLSALHDAASGSPKKKAPRKKAGRLDIANEDKYPVYDKAHASAHPDQTFKHVGNGKYRLVDPQVKETVSETTTTFYDDAHVNAHPDETYAHVGDGRYRRVWKRPNVKRAKSARAPNSSLPATRDSTSESLADMLKVSQEGRDHADTEAQYKSTETYPQPESTPTTTQTPPVQTSRSGRPLHKSRKRKANTEAVQDDVDEDVAQVSEPGKAQQAAQGRVMFVHGDELMTVVALLKVLCTGVNESPLNWDCAAHAMGFRYEPEFLRSRWTYLRTTKSRETQALQNAIREPFLAAYSDGKLPRVDFMDLSATDWPALVMWVQTKVRPLLSKPASATLEDAADAVNLPGTSADLYDRYAVKEPDVTHGTDLNRYFEPITDTARTTTALNLIHGISVPGIGGRSEQPASMLIKSWCRAVAATTEQEYDAEAAARKVSIFPGGQLKQAIDELVDAHVLSSDRRGRRLPGRNFTLHRAAFKPFQRWPGEDTTFLRDVAAARQTIVASLAQDSKVALNFHTCDFEALVLMNMVAQGQVKTTTVLPPRNDALDAPLPRMSIWGVDDVSVLYNSHAMNRDRLRFPVTYDVTATFTPDHKLKHVPIPTSPPLVHEEQALRLPLWLDIHDNVITELWDMVLRSILHLVVYRPGITAKAMEKAHEGKLWAWEAEMVLQWMEETGMAISFGPGEEVEGLWQGGWRAGEWWYCAFCPDVATWPPPAPKAGGEG
ncbi:hypothetical protein LTR03_002528 [Friedmanniomyces endolithicus]|nr:hypothetical protein LTR03_002528 [Friedmanniomyces endolithicus]